MPWASSAAQAQSEQPRTDSPLRGHPRQASSDRTPTHRQPLPRSTRANPFPKVTGPICRLPLPALFISSRGCSPRGPDAVIGTPRRGSNVQQAKFQGPSMASWTPEKPRRSARASVFLPTSGFHTANTLSQTEKTTLPSAIASVFAPFRVTALHIRVREFQPASLSPLLSNCHSA